MTRRYIQPDVVPTKVVKTKKLVKSTRPKRPAKLPLTYEELQSLPAEFRASYVPPKPVAPPKPPKVKEPLDDAFINRRAPGSKTVSFRRQTKQPLYSLYDRLNRTTVLSRDDDWFTYDDHSYHVIIWTCEKNKPADDVNIHLIDYNTPVEEPELYNIFHVTLESKPTSTEYLLETPAGRVCPKCKSNEFVKSDLKNMPINFQSAHWRDRDSFGEHCQVCRCISK